jgi:exonuclease I
MEQMSLSLFLLFFVNKLRALKHQRVSVHPTKVVHLNTHPILVAHKNINKSRKKCTRLIF